MATYIGKRIVPVHCGKWDKSKDYEMLSIVLEEASGDSYISRRVVPAGTAITDTAYWMLHSLYSQQIKDMSDQLSDAEARIKQDNDAMAEAIRKDNKETAEAIKQDNANTAEEIKNDNADTAAEIKTDNEQTVQSVISDNASTKATVEKRVTSAETAMKQAKTGFDDTVSQLNKRMDTVLAAGTGTGDTEILDARVDAEGKEYDTLGSHIRDILPRAKENAAEVFSQTMAENYDAGVFSMEEYDLLKNRTLVHPYNTSTFSGWVSEYEAPADIVVNALRFYIKARETQVSKIRVEIAFGERKDEAIRFEKDLDVNIEPETEQLITCTLPHLELTAGEIIYIATLADAICTHGFFSDPGQENVSWYATNGTLPALEKMSKGTSHHLYMQMIGFEKDKFRADRQQDELNDHEERISEMEEWDALMSEFEKEDFLDNQQNPLPVISAVEKYTTSTFIGWACPIGKAKDFDTLVFSIKNRTEDKYVENVRCFVTLTDKAGDVLADEVMQDVHIAPGEWRKIEFRFSKVIDNTEENELYAGFACDQYVSFMGGETGIILQPPAYGVVTYNASGTPSYTDMMKEPEKWSNLHDPSKNNTMKIDFLIAKHAVRYGLGRMKDSVEKVAQTVAEAEINATIHEKATVALPPRVILPDVFHAVAGDTLQLFYRGFVEHPDPYFYNIEVKCDIGKNTLRYFEVTPTDSNAGDHKLTVNVRDHLGSLLTTAESVIRVHKVGASPETVKNILCVGDSLTSSGIWCAEARRRLLESGGEPAGHALSNIRFVGTKKNGECGYEGYGGWTWASYLSAPSETTLGMWVYCSHDKDNTDQHSLWKDATGNIWSMETIEEDRIKFTRYQSHKGKMPVGAGTLTHYQSASHTADISFSDTAYAEGNPFWDSAEEKVDFQTYCARNQFEGIDCLITLLSWNGMAASQFASSETSIKTHVENAKKLLRIFHEQYPNALVKMMGVQLPSINGGCGQNYGANSGYSNWYGLVCAVMNLNLAYQAMANEDEFKDYVEFINISGQFDSEYNMPRQSKPVNTRSTTTEQIGTNGVHPATQGYYQIGDAAYRALVPMVTEN